MHLLSLVTNSETMIVEDRSEWDVLLVMFSAASLAYFETEIKDDLSSLADSSSELLVLCW